MFPSAALIAEQLSPLMAGRGELLRQGQVVVLVPAGDGWVIRLVVNPEFVLLTTGSCVRILIGEDEPGSLEPVMEVVAAIIGGDLEEFFRVGADKALTSTGHRVWYQHGERRAGSETEVLTVRAPAWTSA